MKCPKCGYVSFDYNDVCPRCNKGITPERDKMQLPSYKPDPPSLLGTLTGKVKKPDEVDLMEAPGTAALLDQELDFATEDLDFEAEDVQATETPEPSFDETFRLELAPEEVSQESPETFEFSESAEEIEEVELSAIESDEDLSIDIEELTIKDSEPGPSAEPSIEDEIILESDLAAIESADTDTTSASESPVLGEETDSLDLDDLIEGEPEITIEEQEAEVPIEMDETVSLDLEDQSPDVPEIALEEQEPEAPFDLDKTISLNLEDLPKDEPEISLEEQTEPEEGKEEALLSLDDLNDEEPDSMEVSSEVSADELVFDQEIDLALDEDTLSIEEIPTSAETSENGEDLSIDLDSLDLDLELEEPDDK